MAYAVPPRPVSFLHSTTMGDTAAAYWTDMGHGVHGVSPMGPMASMVAGAAVSPAPSSLTPPRSEDEYYYHPHPHPQPYVHVHAHVHDHSMENVPQNASQLYAPPVFNMASEGEGEGDVGRQPGQPVMRVVRRRNTANKKERRRTQSINNAYADLRDCIPNVPVDTKLSKIKTLRLAVSYIAYLSGILESGEGDATESGHGFHAELLTQTSGRRPSRRSADLVGSPAHCADSTHGGRPRGGRTGWPEHVWELELKQDQRGRN